MPTWEERCLATLRFASDGLNAIKKMLDPRNVMESGCRVIKHPDCCVLCAANEDCNRLPMHVQCRCKPEPYLSVFR